MVPVSGDTPPSALDHAAFNRAASQQAGRIVAVLGPTNTGKTYLAIERMLGHRSGIIGFPLRLLARENYDRMVRVKGKALVALVTGEEKIVPPGARYFVCTVESMPLDRAVAFLAVDEIQLCADPERGHIFTDRLLHARGLEETMFLGAETIKPLIQRLVPRVEFISRPRFSALTYAGHKKVTRLPPRSAIVAFSAPDVYAIAELIRRQRGGTAVVLGALSPRTRNAQVALYQAGEVDYLVATDAVGMGLNMDVDHVAFARINKFDGVNLRRLKATEIAQIAGRAGRHMADGTFGTTAEVEALDPQIVEAVENHRFDSLQSLMWRNADLRFDSPALLLRSLEQRPGRPDLILARNADDHLTLQALMRDPELVGLAQGRAAVRLLWDVCQIPDFRKVLSDVHTRLLSQIFRSLRSPGGRLPVDWVANQIARLERTEGDIDALVARIAHIRTWTYVSHRPDWLADPAHWQERSRAIEDKLSDALHERLTQRFVDRRSAMLVRTLADGRHLLSAVTASGEVIVEGLPVGRIDGFRFSPDADVRAEDAKALMTAARRALRDEIAGRVGRLEQAVDAALDLTGDGVVTWNGAAVARLTAGTTLLTPGIAVLHDDFLEPAQRDRVRQRVARRVQAIIDLRLVALMRLRDAALSGAARGLAFQLFEGLGSLPRATVADQVTALSRADRLALNRLGLRLGAAHVFLPALVKPAAVTIRALLWAVRHGLVLPAPVPPAGRIAIAAAGVPPAFWDAIGYPCCGPRAIRVDMLDRFERTVQHRLQSGPFAVTADLASAIASTPSETEAVLLALGYRRQPPAADGTVLWRPGKAMKRRAQRSASPPINPETPFAKLRELEVAP
ncbi:MAG: helicase-related protein [Azospirillaceae bacterium]|nr:helicase-related protein [Azospirillaceae bacterium]